MAKEKYIQLSEKEKREVLARVKRIKGGRGETLREKITKADKKGDEEYRDYLINLALGKERMEKVHMAVAPCDIEIYLLMAEEMYGKDVFEITQY